MSPTRKQPDVAEAETLEAAVAQLTRIGLSPAQVAGALLAKAARCAVSADVSDGMWKRMAAFAHGAAAQERKP